MLLKHATLIASALALASAAPLARRATLTAATIQAISPKTSTCDGAPFPDECRDASQAEDPINKSFQKYQINSAGEQAALLALMLYESDNFKYNKNHFPAPGNPGQGTKNMQSPAFNLKYAQSLFDALTVQQAEAKGPEAVLVLVSGDQESFGSAAWFLSNQCSGSIRQGLASGSPEGWTAYLTQCVGTTDNPERDSIWKAALQAME
ncbi:hypothetical protein K469DRAFT_704791 [Zopfia rhizophila CBS 207.26]|uniref:Uncharacterized protein n=1 Tax=Zopfia rhizophila CBS 207.26 TaxID=1314779 RepID=A0A6A6E7D1_9PEZI|nr:hypothetical protein K469DRAFT_704791 [Zopfia rhizophila CBS 207.26]